MQDSIEEGQWWVRKGTSGQEMVRVDRVLDPNVSYDIYTWGVLTGCGVVKQKVFKHLFEHNPNITDVIKVPL